MTVRGCQHGASRWEGALHPSHCCLWNIPNSRLGSEPGESFFLPLIVHSLLHHWAGGRDPRLRQAGDEPALW